MCTRRFVVTRTMLGAREQGWALWNGKEMVEMTSKDIITGLNKGEEILGLAVGADGELEPDKNFFTINIMEHRQCNNYKPMMEVENCVANVFYIVLGKNEKNEYEVISTKFERTAFTEERVKFMLEMGVISAGAKLEGNKVVLPVVAEKKPETKLAVAEKQDKPTGKK